LFKKFFHALGLGQTRCVHCLRPFSPSASLSSFQSPCAPPEADALLCPDCEALFTPYSGPRCPLCGLPNTTTEALCGSCLQHPPPWDGLGYHGIYQGALRDALLRLKFAGEISLAPLLGTYLHGAAANLPRPDALIAVPQHPAQLRKRGFNQAHELARELHNLCGVPLRPELLSRPRPHTPQSGLSASERRRNMNNAFFAEYAATGLVLWLIDDIMTTGVTLSASVKALRNVGAQKVHVLFVARTPLTPDPPRQK
jgi:ComF family protein